MSGGRAAPGRLLAALGLREGEAELVAPAALLAFACVGASTLAAIAADALFVATFSLGELARFVVLSALVRVGAAAGYGALASTWVGRRGRLPLPRLDALLLALTAALLAAAAALAHTGAPAAVYVACVALLVLPPLLPLVAFNAATEGQHARQAKRLLPLVAAAATVGSMAAGAAAGLFARPLGAGGLLLLGAALCLAALPLLWLPLLARGRAAGGAEEPAPAGGGEDLARTLAATLRDVRDVPVVRLVVSVALTSAVAVTLIDYALKAALKAAYGRDAMAAFLGALSLVANGLVLSLQLFFAGRFLVRFGVRASLAAFPASLLALGPALILAPGVAAAVAAKLAEQLFRYALGGPSGDLVLTPAPPAVRTRAKVVIKAVAGPTGALLAGVLLAAFGEPGPPAAALGALLAAAGAAGLWATAGARRAYAAALGAALGEGAVPEAAQAASAAVLRAELGRMLAERAAAGDVAGTRKLLSAAKGPANAESRPTSKGPANAESRTTLTARFFSLADVEPLLRAAPADPEAAAAIRSAAARAALQLAGPDEGARLLALLPPDDDPALEREILAAAAARGAAVPRERLERAAAVGAAAEDRAGADLWAAALAALCRHDRSASLRALRRGAAASAPAPRRAAALRALGELGDLAAEREVLAALGASDPAVFLEAARAAVRLDAGGAITSLVEHLTIGPHVRAAADALALAGPRAVADLLAALPTTRGEQGVVATAVANGRAVPGTVRAARVLARLGPDACARALERFGDLGYRARNAIARAFAAVSPAAAAADRAAVQAAMELTVRYAELLVGALAAAPPAPAAPGLLRAELRHRVGETGARLLDLASTIGDRPLIARARAALARPGRRREDALELLENVLPGGLAARTVALLDALAPGAAPSAAESAGARPPVRFDGWLEKCAQLDAGALPAGDPMRPVLERVVILREAPLFAGLSGEELYPVAELAEPLDVAPGAPVVSEGEPVGALFVVAGGVLSMRRAGRPPRALARGATFGETALLEGATVPATVTADGAARLLRLGRADVEALLEESPELARGLIRTLLGHLGDRLV